MKKTLFVIGMLLCGLSLYAQDMKTLFIAMPDSVAPLLTKVNREDCVDFLASNMKAEVKNRFGKVSELHYHKPDRKQYSLHKSPLQNHSRVTVSFP